MLLIAQGIDRLHAISTPFFADLSVVKKLSCAYTACVRERPAQESLVVNSRTAEGVKCPTNTQAKGPLERNRISGERSIRFDRRSTEGAS